MRKLMIGLLALAMPYIANAQTKQHSSLLWSITGPGIKSPSYLFGTIHVKNKKAFNFPDSVLLKLDECQAFAMEINLDSALWYMFKTLDNNSEYKLKMLLGEKKYAELRRKMQEETGIDPEILKNKNPLLLKNFINPFGKSYNDMPTFLDAYLYGISRKQGKTFLAVEDFRDQMQLFDQISQQARKDIVETEYTSSGKFYTQKLIDLYASNDLEGIEAVSHLMPEEAYEAMFTRRNIKMSERIDSFVRNQSTFIAIGSGHLPGREGVIELLRKKGYTVRPVYPTYKGLAAQFKPKETELPWVRTVSNEGGYSIEVPSQPLPFNISATDVDIKMSMDITTGLTYFSTAYFIPDDSSKKDKKMLSNDRLINNWKKNGFKVSSKRILTTPERKTYEYILQRQQFYFKARIFFSNNVCYFNMVGSENPDLNHPDGERFFSSIQLFSIKPASWELFSSKEGAFEIYFPGTPKEKNYSTDVEKKGTKRTTMYVSTDTKKAITYVVQYMDANGLYYPSDSMYFAAAATHLKQSLDPVKEQERTIELDGFKGTENQYSIKDGTSVKLFHFLRGNRGYVLIAGLPKGSENNPDAQTFFKSFRFLPYQGHEWNKYNAPDSSFAVLFPSEPEIKGIDLAYHNHYDTAVFYSAIDKYSGASYIVQKFKISPYFYSADSVHFLRKTEEDIKQEGDSIVQEKDVTVQNYPAKEYLLQNRTSNNVEKSLILQRGDELYLMFTYLPRQYLNNDSVYERFFRSIALEPSKTYASIFTRKTDKILTDLLSSDSAKRIAAKKAFHFAKFDKKDLSGLYTALLKNYPDDTLSDYSSSRGKLLEAIGEVADSSFVDFMKNNYPKFDNYPKLQMKALRVLANMKTNAARQTMADYLLTSPPKDYAYSLFYALYDSLELNKRMFPEVLKLCSDTLYKSSVLDLTAQMLEKNIITTETLKDYYSMFYKEASADLKQKEKDEDLSLSLTGILGYIHTGESVVLLKAYCESEDGNTRLNASVNLLKNNQDVKQSLLSDLAGDMKLRLKLYEELKKIKKEELFPKKYLTQKYFAESRIYSGLDLDDEVPDKIELKAIKETEYKGKVQRFYLFKVVVSNDDEKTSYFGVSGPYPLDEKEVIPSEDLLVNDYSKFDEKTPEEHLNDFLVKNKPVE